MPLDGAMMDLRHTRDNRLFTEWNFKRGFKMTSASWRNWDRSRKLKACWRLPSDCLLLAGTEARRL